MISSFVLLTLTYGGGSGGLQRGVSTIFSPLTTVADRALKPARDLVNWFDQTFDARGENSRLKAQLQHYRKEAIAGQAAQQESAQLSKLLKLDRSGVMPSGVKPVTGRVVVRSPTVWYSVVTIDIGGNDGVRVNDPVVTGDGLVGHISSVAPGSSQVTLITDPGSAVTAKIVPAGTEGVVKPRVGSTTDLSIEFLNSNRRVGRGDNIVTSGWRWQEIASHYPPNIPIGVVTKAPIAELESNQSVQLRPFADLADLDFVQVWTGGWRG